MTHIYPNYLFAISQFLSRQLLCCLLIFSLSVCAASAQGFESFSDLGLSTNFATRQWLGNNGIVWMATQAREDQTITGKAITIRKGTITFGLTAGQMAAGIDTLGFDAKAPFGTPPDVGTIELIVNGISQGDLLTSGLDNDDVVHYSFGNINIPVITSIELKQTTGGSKITIDNIEWAAVTGLPGITISNNGTQTGNQAIYSNTLDNILAKAKLRIINGPVSIASMNFTATAASTYVASDIIAFKLYSSADPQFSTATATLVQTKASVKTNGVAETIIFNTPQTGLDDSLYYFLTADIAASAISGHNLKIATFNSVVAPGATVMGSASATGITTIVGPPVVNTATFTGTVAVTFNNSLTASNSPQAFAIVSGSLPPGLTLNTTTGAITGTPGAAGSFQISVTASNPAGTSAAVTITINITGIPVTGTFYRSKVDGGLWSAASSWETSPDNGITPWSAATAPPSASAAQILIRIGFSIVSNSTVNADDIIIDSTASLTISGGIFTLVNGAAVSDLLVNGSLIVTNGSFNSTGTGIVFTNGALYTHGINGGLLPVAEWADSSTCLVKGMINNQPGRLGQDFGNFTWNSAAQAPGTFVNIEDDNFNTRGTLQVGPADANQFSFVNAGGIFSNTVHDLLLTGGELSISRNNATETLTVTDNVVITGGTLFVGRGGGQAFFTVANDLIISGGLINVINNVSTPEAQFFVNRDLVIKDSGRINLERVGSPAVGRIIVLRDFMASGTSVAAGAGNANGMIDFGEDTNAGNAVVIGRNFTKTGDGTFGTSSNSAADGFLLAGGSVDSPAVFIYEGASSNKTNYRILPAAFVEMQTNLQLGQPANPASRFAVDSAGTLNFLNHAIIAAAGSPARFITANDATLITSSNDGLGGITATGNLQNFQSTSANSAAGAAQFAAGLHYIFNADTDTPFPTGAFGNPSSLEFNARVQSNRTVAMTVTDSVHIYDSAAYTLNPSNGNNLLLGGVMTIDSTGTFDNGGENQIRDGGTPTIFVRGLFITRDAQGFTGTNAAVPAIAPALFMGSAVEFGRQGNQDVNARPDFKNITFSGSGIKLLKAGFNPLGTVLIKDSAVGDARNFSFGNGNTNLLMQSGRFRLSGTGVKPNIDGSYALNGGVVEFYNNATTRENIKGKNGAGDNIIYRNIEVTGTNVGNSNSNIILSATGDFTVKPNGVFIINANTIRAESLDNTAAIHLDSASTFRTGNSKGFSGYSSGFGANSSIDTSIAASRIYLQPGSTVDYAGPSAALISNQLPYQNLRIGAPVGVVKTAPADTLEILGNFSKTTAAVFNANGGSVLFSGNTSQQYSSTNGPVEFNNLINRSAALTIKDSLSLSTELQLEAGSALSLDSGSRFILRSGSGKTANVAPIPTTAAISYDPDGKFVVERYINVGDSAPYHPKSWQFLAVPTTGQTLNTDYQEGSVIAGSDPRPGYGTQLTRPSGTGYDATTPASSIKSFNSSTGNWNAGPASTFDSTRNPNGWLVFVRGDRSLAAGSAGTGTSTTMRTSGMLYRDQQQFTIPANQYAGVGNPYASAIDLRNTSRTNLTNEIYIWDPTLGGNFGVGGYRTLTRNAAGTHWLVSPSGGIYPGPIVDTIQSGQAFLVKSNGIGTSSFLMDEQTKVGGSRLITRFTDEEESLVAVNLYKVTTGNELMDGAMTMFDNDYNTLVNWEDGAKFNNAGETVGFRSHGNFLSVERRKPVLAGDTLHLDFFRAKAAKYRWQFMLTNITVAGGKAFLLDKWNNSKTPIALHSNTDINFTVTADGASAASDRFKIVFAAALAGPLPLRFTGITATRNAGTTIAVRWTVEHELNVKTYVLERSTNGRDFTDQVSVDATGSRTYAQNDLNPLQEDNYYRIRSVDIDGKIQYSDVAKVRAETVTASISVYPNPVVGRRVQIRFANLKGEYKIQLTNKAAQVIYSGSVVLNGGQVMKNIELNAVTAAGAYQLLVVDNKGTVFTEQVIVD